MYTDQLVLESNPSLVKKRYVKNMFHMVACIGVRRRKTSSLGKLRSGELWDPGSSWANELALTSQQSVTDPSSSYILFLSFGPLSKDFKFKCLPF